MVKTKYRGNAKEKEKENIKNVKKRISEETKKKIIRGKDIKEKKLTTKPKTEKKPSLEPKEIKISFKKIEIPNSNITYKVAVKFSGEGIKDIPIPPFLLSVLSLPKIPIGEIRLKTKSEYENRLSVLLEFEPSSILKLLTKHERFSYSSSIAFSKENGYITTKTEYIESKTDGRNFVKKKDYDFDDNVKDPVALFLDFLSSKDEIEKELKKIREENEDIEDIKYDLDILEDFKIEKENEGNELKKIKIIPKREEGKEILKYAEVDLTSFGEFKIPQRFYAQGLLSLFDVFIEKS
ncbi:MAG: hypothetical protein RRA63_05610 [Candidatus Calescibacterium sp.]|jgi:hypothetical protein|nr:hypothetical protein [Candidatus Calescibacterium sp.]